MLLFCPSCSNMLIITTQSMDQATPSDPNIGKNRFECRTCPYQMVLDKKYYERKNFELKGAEDVLGGADSWKNVDSTETRCKNESCDSTRAYFRQVQIRSADEPMTTFYRCVKCNTDWRENDDGQLSEAAGETELYRCIAWRLGKLYSRYPGYPVRSAQTKITL